MVCFYSKYLSDSIKHCFFPFYLSTRCEQITFEYLAVSVFQKILIRPYLAKAVHVVNECLPFRTSTRQQNVTITSSILTAINIFQVHRVLQLFIINSYTINWSQFTWGDSLFVFLFALIYTHIFTCK